MNTNTRSNVSEASKQRLPVEIIVTSAVAEEWRFSGRVGFPLIHRHKRERQEWIESIYLVAARRYAERNQLPGGCVVSVSVSIAGSEFATLDLNVGLEKG
jgi:hypothetical protein